MQDDLISKFLSHVASSPEKIAIIYSQQLDPISLSCTTTSGTLTYQQLYREVSAWKALLRQRIKKGIVLVCLERTPRLLAVLLALQWLEIPYIPIDLATPIERLRLIIQDSQATAILYDTKNLLRNASFPCLSWDLSRVKRFPVVKSEMGTYTPKQAAIAYIIYTSGSTGTPKGVVISRQALNHFLTRMSAYFLKEDQALLLAITTISFDIAALELYLPLWQQKTIFLSNQQEHHDPEHLVRLLQQYPITLLQATPAMWSMLKNIEWSGKKEVTALCGGEPLSDILAQYLLPRVAELWNMYGPTEATVWCALKQIRENEPITIGHPIPGMEMRVLDRSLRALPAYVKGELYIAGAGLAEGYLHQEALTRARFIPCADALGGYLYKTGDIACSTTEGEFIVFGRSDNQIKLHGYRIELEEIEAQLHKAEGVQECAVMPYEDHLLAYICPSFPISFSKKRMMQHLAKYLPVHMLPRQVVLLIKLPRMPNGKLDRKSLPTPDVIASTKTLVEGSQLTSTQIALMSIWMEALHISTIHPQDNFFDIGGHSLLATQVITDIAHRLNKQISLQDFLRVSTIKALAQLVDQAQPIQTRAHAIPAAHNKYPLPLNDFQLLFWLSILVAPALKTLNISGRQRVTGTLNQEALDFALQWVYEQQEVFSYRVSRFLPVQKKQRKKLPTWQLTSLISKNEAATEALLNTAFDALSKSSTWPVHAPKMSAKLFFLKNNQVELQIAMPHYLADEESINVFFRDLSKAYLFYVQHRPLCVSGASQAYSAYVWHQQEIFQKFESKDADFWKHYLQDAGLAEFTSKYIVTDTTKKAFAFSTYIEIQETLLTQLRTFCDKHSLTFNDVLSAALAIALLKCGQNDIKLPAKVVMNIIKSTRRNASLANAIGCFLQIDSIKLGVNLDQTLLSLSQQAQQSALETSEYQRAASLIKLASIGKMSRRGGSLLSSALSVAISMLSKVSQWIYLSPSLLKACQTLAMIDRQKTFLININILSDFFSSPTALHKQTLFDLPCEVIPLHKYDVPLVEYVLETCFLRSHDHTPYVVISANLTPEFRQRLGETLLAVIQSEVSR
ncbi:MAG: amino acid adenylation domain-containing protein [Legionellaceae bacterium]|nr:amino acid adenylation domain-containing protein [Legionellaceae bacterium]